MSRPNQRDLIVAAHQELTREWWENRRNDFTLFASAVVIEEALRGDPEYARARMSIIDQLRLADVSRAAHLANAARLPRINDICRSAGFQPPYVSTPEELIVG